VTAVSEEAATVSGSATEAVIGNLSMLVGRATNCLLVAESIPCRA